MVTLKGYEFGTLALRLGMEISFAVGIREAECILNGMINSIPTQMEASVSYAVALTEAQNNGCAEADPTGDVAGQDAAAKFGSLADLLVGLPMTMQDAQRHGITDLTSDDLTAALADGERTKLIGSIARTSANSFAASVRPVRVPLEHSLPAIGGATNAIAYSTELLGNVTLVGPSAGLIETGCSTLSHLLTIHRKAKPDA